MHRLKAGLVASFACSRLDSRACTGWPNSVIFSSIPDRRGTNTKDPATPREKREGCAARAVSFAELGKTPSCPGGWAVSRCLASQEHCDGNPRILPMVFINNGDNSSLTGLQFAAHGAEGITSLWPTLSLVELSCPARCDVPANACDALGKRTGPAAG